MNSKAIKRQLLAAIAMVLVAALALGSSTYAWFVAAGTVTAQGMSVHATSEGGLVISYGDSEWGIVANAADAENIALNPTSTVDMSNWFHATAQKSADYIADETTRTNVTSSVMNGNTFINGGTNTYVVAKTFNIRSTGDSAQGNLAQGLYVSNITVTGASKQMSTALRVGIICDFKSQQEKGPFIYGPVKIGDGTGQNAAKSSYPVFGAYNKATQTNGENLGTVTLLDFGPSIKDKPLLGETVVIPNSTDTTNYVKVTVVIWFEGEDWNLVSDKYNTDTLNITVDFSSLGSSGKIV